MARNVGKARQSFGPKGESEMATYDLDRTELNHLLTPNIDPSARTAILDYLFNGVTPGSHVAIEDDHGSSSGGESGDDGHARDGKTGSAGDDHVSHVTVKTVEVQVSDGTQPLDKDAVVLDLTSADNFVTTDSALKVIVENVATDSHLYVGGTHGVLIATGDGNDQVTLADSGNDIVMTGKGNDSVYAGAGHDSVYAGAGNDLLVAGSGSHQLLEGGKGSDLMYGGGGAYDSVIGGTGPDIIIAGDGAHQLLQGGKGADAIYG